MLLGGLCLSASGPIGVVSSAVMNMRKVEKAAAIKAKRVELENLRKAIAAASGQEAPTVMAPIAGGPHEMPHEPGPGRADGSIEGRGVDPNKTIPLAEPPQNPVERGSMDEAAHRPHHEEREEANRPKVSMPEKVNSMRSPVVSSSSTGRQGGARPLTEDLGEMDDQVDQSDVLQIVDRQDSSQREPAARPKEVHGTPRRERGNFGRFAEQRAGYQGREMARGSTEDEGDGSISVASQEGESGERGAECCSERSQDQGVGMEPIPLESPSLLPGSKSEGYPLHR